MKVRIALAGALAAGGLVVLTAPAGGAATAGGDSGVVSSDGSAISVAEASGTTSGSYSGSGAPITRTEVDLTGFAPMTPNGRAESGTESIIGADNRFRINPTTSYPARATVLITFSTPQGGSRCTGWFIGRNTVMTAGHCVHRGFGGGAGFYNAASYRLFPGYNGNFAPFGTCFARTLTTATSWTLGGGPSFDWGIIKLTSSCATKGNQVGFYGFTSALALNQGTAIQGYPGDKPFTQWKSFDRVRVIQTNRIFYQNDTTGGMSGSAVVGANASCNPCGIAIHAYGTGGGFPSSANNGGTRITPGLFNIMLAFKNAA